MKKFKHKIGDHVWLKSGGPKERSFSYDPGAVWLVVDPRRHHEGEDVVDDQHLESCLNDYPTFVPGKEPK